MRLRIKYVSRRSPTPVDRRVVFPFPFPFPFPWSLPLPLPLPLPSPSPPTVEPDFAVLVHCRYSSPLPNKWLLRVLPKGWGAVFIPVVCPGQSIGDHQVESNITRHSHSVLGTLYSPSEITLVSLLLTWRVAVFDIKDLLDHNSSTALSLYREIIVWASLSSGN